VTVGGQIVKELGTKVDLARISVAVDGQKVQQEKLVYFAVNKPKGFVSTNNDPSGRPRVVDILPQIAQRVYTVGRLDEMSVGLMLMTNDGELANKLAHPRFGVEKLYRVIVAGTPEQEVLKQLTEGIWLAEGKVRAKRVRVVGKKGDATILELVLAEGKNREVRRMLAKLGHKVMMLTRVAVGPITLKGLAAGQFRPLTGREVDLLRRVAAGEAVPMPWATDRRPRPEGDRRPPNREGRDQSRSFGSAPPRPGGAPPSTPRGPSRPHGPGYRPEPMADDRRSGPSMGMRSGPAGAPPQRGPGGPPRRPGMFQAAPDDSVVRRYGNDRPSGPSGGPPRRDSNGPRPYQNGPPQNRSNGPRPYQDGPPQGRSNGPRPYNDGPPQGARGSGPRPGRPSGGPQGRPPYSASNDSGPRPPRFGPRPGEDRPPTGGDHRRDNRSNGPRGFERDDRRDNQSNGPRRFAGNDRPNNNSRPGGSGGGNGGGDRRPQTNRPRPLPTPTEPTRKVIGLDASVASPGPSEDRPKSRLKRPAPRGAAPSPPRPMPKRRPTRRGDD